MTRADEIIEGPIRGPLFEVMTDTRTIAVFEDGHVTGMPEGCRIINHAAPILAVLRGEILRLQRLASARAAAIPSRDELLARVRRLIPPKAGEEQTS